MDVPKTKEKRKIDWSRKSVWVAGSLLLLSCLSVLAYRSSGQVNIDRSEVLIEKVMQGDLEVRIEGYGSLKSERQQLISALTRATVKEILLKPGAPVKAESVIVRLENAELQQDVYNAENKLAEHQANLRQLKLSQQREILNEEAKLAEVAANYEKAQLLKKSYQELNSKGVIADIKLQEVVLDEQRWHKQQDILKQRLEQLKEVHDEAVNVELEKIKQYEGMLNIALSRLDRLDVKARIDGVLQALPVELGQSLEAGQQIALIGSVTDLVALIRVPQSQAQPIAIGQNVIVSTRRDEIIGKVSRIDPVVQDNNINIEVALPKELPLSARPQMNVDATIIAEKLEQITYIKRPAKVRPNSKARLYKLDHSLDSADLQEVSFGRQAGDYIEIVTGAQPDELFIISDMSGFSQTTPRLGIL